jgi:hypothetical protein
MRPRLKDTDLPKRVYLRRGAYYYVAADGRWLPLGRTREGLEWRAELAANQMERIDILRRVKQASAKLTHRSQGRRAVTCDLQDADLVSMLDAANWRCAVTQTPFSMRKFGNRYPFAPSIDRIDSQAGYTRTNCRVVCLAANFAMNVWGHGVLWAMLTHFRANERAVLDCQIQTAPKPHE